MIPIKSFLLVREAFIGLKIIGQGTKKCGVYLP
jgi:hypothetical protein